jgi:hypothetical protein
MGGSKGCCPHKEHPDDKKGKHIQFGEIVEVAPQSSMS